MGPTSDVERVPFPSRLGRFGGLSGSAGHWRAQVAVNHPRKLWGFKSLPAHAQQTFGPDESRVPVGMVDKFANLGHQIGPGLNSFVAASHRSRYRSVFRFARTGAVAQRRLHHDDAD